MAVSARFGSLVSALPSRLVAIDRSISSNGRQASQEPPLCVDLDGTLLRTDTFLESLFAVLHQRPLTLLALPFWLLRGRAHLKRQCARLATIDVSTLPLHEEFVAFLRDESRAGRHLVLCTAADGELARALADRVGFFNEVLASDGATNLKGKHKCDALVKRFGTGGFDYAGNSAPDLSVWKHAREALLVNVGPWVAARAIARARVARRFEGPRPAIRSVARALRIHQWTKNLLVFIPFLAGHKFSDPVVLRQALLAFFAFSCGASALYIVNDLVDLEHDRRHATKRRRPFAAGTLPLGLGLILAPALLAAASGLALAVSLPLLGMLGLYLTSSLMYSFALKDFMILDVIVLALLYTLRVLAGGIATDTPVSNWLLMLSIFLFLSLALVKRVTELRSMQVAGNAGRVPGRGYAPDDLGPLAGLGAASGFIAVVVFALYLNSSDVTRLYRRPDLLWMVSPLLIYWVSRIWLLAQRGELHEDPLVFAIRDRASWIVAVLAALVVATSL